MTCRERQLAAFKAQLQKNAMAMSFVDTQWLQQLALHAWKFECRSAHCQNSHQSALTQASAAASAEQAAMRGEAAREFLTLRLKWRSQGIRSINHLLEHSKRAPLLAWASVAQAARDKRLMSEQFQRQTKELGECRKMQGHFVAQAAVEHMQLASFRAWRAALLVVKCEADAAHQLEVAAADATKQKAEVEQQARDLASRLSGELRSQGLRLGRTHMVFQKRMMLLRWAIATRDARAQAAHRRQLITAAADASAEVYRLRAEAKKVAVELRKQRRAHGVAAIHANLDRRLQSVLLAWSSVVRDGQREAAYQRQLDIAAAESAAGCAVLRMEGRRATLELREERRAQALRAIDAGLRHWQHLALREWWSQTVSCRQQAQHLSELREQAADCEARISSSLSTAAGGAEALAHQVQLQHAVALKAQEASAEAQATEVTRLCSERDALQAQITKLHDELRRHHGQP
jgi:hypothetical protein